MLSHCVGGGGVRARFHSVWVMRVTGVSSCYDFSALIPLMELAFINVVSEVLSLPYIYAKIFS